MFKVTRCAWKGHVFVDSRSQPGTRVCVRCRERKPFETMTPPKAPGMDSGQTTAG